MQLIALFELLEPAVFASLAMIMFVVLQVLYVIYGHIRRRQTWKRTWQEV